MICEIQNVLCNILDEIEQNNKLKEVCVLCLDDILPEDFVPATHISLKTNLLIVHQTGYHMDCWTIYLEEITTCPLCRMDLFWNESESISLQPRIQERIRTITYDIAVIVLEIESSNRWSSEIWFRFIPITILILLLLWQLL